MRFVRGVEFGRVTYWLQTLRSWKRWKHRKWTLEHSKQKEVIFPKENGKFTLPVADGRIGTPGGDQELRTSTLIRQRSIQGESHVDFLGESEGSLPPPHDSFPMPVKQLMTSGPWQETPYTAITLNQESNFTRREKNHSLFHWNTLTFPELQERIWMLKQESRIDDY